MPTALRLLRSYRLQNLLVEFAGLKHVQLQGIYVSLTPRDPTLWTGTLFVRKGVYTPAVLRFRISFPSSYPFAPPVITFSAEIFHPLLTPLSTYTHSASAGDESVSNDGDERLPPGGFSLRHGFPSWFGRETGPADEPSPASTTADAREMKKSFGAGDGESTADETIHIIDVLRYMRECFEDAALLDSIPFEAAANPSAWYAWQSHRGRSTKADLKNPDAADSSANTGPQTPQARARRPSDWNWEGVWVERVKKAVHNSLAEQVLYGAGGGGKDEVIHFLDVDEEGTENMRAELRAQMAPAQP